MFLTKQIQPHFHRLLHLLLIFGYVILFALKSHGQNNFKPIYTPSSVTANRNIPNGALKPGETITVYFSKEPTDAEIYNAHFFEEPLVPLNTGIVSEQENKDLVIALAVFSQRNNEDDFTAITQFLYNYPESRWNGALLVNLGILYRRTGYYDKAMEVWMQAWELMKGETEHSLKILADKVITEILLINCWVGRVEIIEPLLNQISSREMEGSASERILDVKQSLWQMKNSPEISFKCGPYALCKILNGDSIKPYNEMLLSVKSGKNGFSLSEVAKMAKDVGLKYQMAYRQPGANVILNSVIHWKLNHYSALVKFENGHYGCQDITMGKLNGELFWLTPEALDSSASGYFLIPDGTLQTGWRSVSTEEGGAIYGRGAEPPPNKFLTPQDLQLPDCPIIGGMAQCNVHAVVASLHIFDRPLFYTPPKGPPVIFDLDYLQRDIYQPSNFNYSNFGQKWTFNWLSYLQDNPANQSADVKVYIMGGGQRTFSGYSFKTKSYQPEFQTKDILVRIDTSCYELRHPDGSKEIYSRPDGSLANGRKVFLTQKIDPRGNAVKIFYDNNLRITALQDAIGQVTTISYDNASDIFKITKVTDPFGRAAIFTYDNLGNLASIKDMIGMTSSFLYETNFIYQMTTPYGNTKFEKSENVSNYLRTLETTYPLGEKERVEYRGQTDEIPYSDSVAPAGMPLENGRLVYRNTFFWNKKAMKDAPSDVSKAKIYHWLHYYDGNNVTAAPILESIKEPLENRLWYYYQGQVSNTDANQGMSSKPAYTGRVLDDGVTQLSKSNFNSLDKDTISIDPLGRTFVYKYDSTKINLLEIRQKKGNATELIAKFTYNTQYLPLTSTDAAGQTTYYTYNTVGQLLTVRNPKNETTTLTYDANGYLKSITGPVAGANVSFSYDGFGRVRTVTDQEGYTITTDYDALDRPTVITYPDKTFEQIVYDRLDAVHMRDRLGRWSHAIYDSLDRLAVSQDELGRITQFIWCGCGSLEEIVDPLKQITTFEHDLQGRLTAKTYDNGKSINYQYENTTSRLKQITDAKGQATNYAYYNDDNVRTIKYSNALIPTDSVFFSYDDKYNRLDTMIDGTGITSYSYYPITNTPSLGAGMLQNIDGPLSNDIINYTYDSVGRISGRSINGVASSIIYDALGRITSATNALGVFNYTYVTTTNRIASILNPNGTSSVFSYFDNNGDKRLKQIWNKKGSTTLSKFNYDYNAEGQITKWTQQTGSNTPKYYEIGYDLADQITSATQKNQSTNTILKRYSYTYDIAGNRTSEQIDNTVTAALYNTLNQMTVQQDGGAMRFKGLLDEYASVSVKNNTTSDSSNASVDSATNSFEAFVDVKPGVNNITVAATDYSGNSNRNVSNYAITVKNGSNNNMAFDDNGNMISATNPNVVYAWDAADRLVKITKGASITEFVYDGLGRRVAEKMNGTVIKRWLWCGTELCEERDATGNNVTKRFFTQGEQIGGINYYFTSDHLGSVREMTDASGNVKVRYDYDPYGRRTKISGTADADFGFTGHYYHSVSGLYLTLYRAYNPSLGRWLNRDPIGEAKELNLYAYCQNNPVLLVDKLGLCPISGNVIPYVVGGIAIVAGGLVLLPEGALAAILASSAIILEVGTAYINTEVATEIALIESGALSEGTEVVIQNVAVEENLSYEQLKSLEELTGAIKETIETVVEGVFKEP